MRNVSDKIFAVEITTHISSSVNFFPENRALYEIMYCCFSTAATVTRTRHNVTLHVQLLSLITLPFTSRFSMLSPSIGFPPTKVCILLLRMLPHIQVPFSAPFLNSRSLCSSLRTKDKVLLLPKTTRKTVRVFTPYVISVLRVLYLSNPGSK